MKSWAFDKDILTKESIEAILVGFYENLFKNDDDKASYTYGISIVLNRSAEEIKVNWETNSWAQFIDNIIEEEIIDPKWQEVKEKFVNWHYFWDV